MCLHSVLLGRNVLDGGLDFVEPCLVTRNPLSRELQVEEARFCADTTEEEVAPLAQHADENERHATVVVCIDGAEERSDVPHVAGHEVPRCAPVVYKSVAYHAMLVSS